MDFPVWFWVVIPLAAVAPSWGTLGAGLVAEVSAVLGFVHREGPFADWLTSQYDVRFVRFWRPLATTTIGLQVMWTSADAVPLRLFNLACHASTAVLIARLALRLSLGKWGAFVAGILFAFYPHQGGTVTWVVGRVDSLCLPLLVAACLSALDGRPVRTAIFSFLAMATKETALVLPLWIFVLTLGRNPQKRLSSAARSAAPAFLVLCGVLVWRRLALGVWLGGYMPLGGAAPGLGELLVPGLWHALVVLYPGLLITGALGLLAHLSGCHVRRIWICGLVASLVGILPVMEILAIEGAVSTNLRRFLLTDTGLALAMAACFAGPPRRKAVFSVLLLVLVGTIAWRGVASRTSTLKWARGGEVGATLVNKVRRALADIPPATDPVLVDKVPITRDGALVLAYGLADHFRPPFSRSPRPVWPWRPLFHDFHSRRAPVIAANRGLLWPFEEGNSGLARIPVRILDGSAVVDVLHIDRRILDVGSQGAPAKPILEIEGAYPDCRLEVIVVTEVGYEPAVLSVPGRGAGCSTLRISCSDLLAARLSSFGLHVLHVLGRAADLGSRYAYIEVRALAADAAGNLRTVAASRWLRIEWMREARDWVFPK